jgi:pilus assembly protein CpaB
MRGRGWMLVLLSVVLAGLAAIVAGKWISGRAAAAGDAQAGRVSVAVAAMEIPFGTRVEARHVRSIQMLTGTDPPGVYNKEEEVIGKIAKATLVAGELLLRAKFVQQDEGSTLSALVAPEMRAVSIRVDDVVGVGGFLLPGNRVDVVASRQENDKATAETILSDVKVLAVDQSASTEKNEPVVVRAVTLEVTPEDAEALVRARELGRLQLTLRNPMDRTIVAKKKPPAPVPVAMPRVDRPKAPPPPPPPPPQPQVQIIRGTDVATHNGP